MSEVSNEKECDINDIKDDCLYMIVEEDEDPKTGLNKARFYLIQF